MEYDACSEIWFLLGELGDEESQTEPLGISGIVIAKTILNEFFVVKDLRQLLKERPDEFKYILRVIPIERVVKTNLEEIRKSSIELSKKILNGEKFMIRIEKRHSNISRKNIICRVADEIDRKVDLKKPDKIVLIEVLGSMTGVSVIESEDILSTAKEKPSALKCQKSGVFD